MSDGCLECGQGFHFECPKCDSYASVYGWCLCMPWPEPDVDSSPPTRSSADPGDDGTVKAIGRPRKSDDELVDPWSTHHKRAVKVLSDTGRRAPGKLCEWAGFINCGGGKHPITGCAANLAEDVHHGPNKDISENTPLNLHFICSTCHHNWHTANDPCYDQGGPFLSHRPHLATQDEIEIPFKAPVHENCQEAKDDSNPS